MSHITTIIQAFVYDTELELTSKIKEIDLSKGLPYDGMTSFCTYQFNNNKWIVKLAPEKGMEEMFLPKVAEDFDFKESYSYYIDFNSLDDIIKLYTYNLYPEPFRVLNINDLSEFNQDIMNTLRSRIELDYPNFTRLEFVRKDSLVKIHSESEGVITLLLSEMPAAELTDYESVGNICNELIEI
jgi:hypothetical protein